MTTFRVTRGDALEGLAALEPGSVHAIITDPPYCSGAISEAGRKRATSQGLRSESVKDRFQWFDADNMGTQGLVWALRSVAVRGAELMVDGHLGVFADWRMVSAIQPAIESAGWSYRGLVVWDKGSMGLGVGFRAQHELMLHFQRGAPGYGDSSVGNVIQVPRVRRDDRKHPTQKPVELLRRIVRVLTQPGDVVVDPFCGSGATGIAALHEGRGFIGFDVSAQHVATATEALHIAAGDVEAAGGGEQGVLL